MAYQVLKLAGSPADEAWLPLNMIRGLVNETEDIDRNISATLATDYVPLNVLLDQHSGAVSIVGSGPSLKRTWRELTGDVWACNSAGQFLLEKGIVPKYWMMFDADPLIAPAITAHPDVTYLVASRCPRVLFEKLNGCHIVVWHGKGDKHIDDLLAKEMLRRKGLTGQWEMEPMCGGGSTAVTRSMFLVHTLGYRVQHLFGADSSYEEGGNVHLDKSADDHQQKPFLITTGPRNPHKFLTTTWLAGQAEDFKVLSESLRKAGVRIVVHGDGLIPHIAKEMGFDVDKQSRVKQLARSMAQTARLLWQQV